MMGSRAVNDLGVYSPRRAAIFAKHVTRDDPSGCWLWTAARDRDGYGRTTWRGRHVGSHRVAYMLWKGPIPEGLVVDHRCGVRHCVNPGHLEPVTQRVNVHRDETVAALNGAKTHCIAGHELAGDNLRVQARTVNGRSYPMRVCLACKRDRKQAAA